MKRDFELIRLALEIEGASDNTGAKAALARIEAENARLRDENARLRERVGPNVWIVDR